MNHCICTRYCGIYLLSEKMMLSWFLLLLPVAAFGVYVETDHGWVYGMVTQEAIVFLGIPYAQPPARWEIAAPIRRWRGVWDARRIRPMCMQPPCSTVDSLGVCVPQMSEDCLYLNVILPPNVRRDAKLPVIVFLHGGSFESFTGGGELYNGERFANKGNVILVTINYRLGAFGFMVGGYPSQPIAPNLGIKDQRLAMQWVNRNIDKFGGDPQKVTLMGHSAGALSVGIHLINGKSDKLFQNAILLSPILSAEFKTFQEATGIGQNLSKILNCSFSDLTCLRSKSPMEILEAQDKVDSNQLTFLQKYMTWIPHMDGDEVPLNVLRAIDLGYYIRKPIMVGTTSGEGISYVYNTFPTPLTRSNFGTLLLMLKPTDAVQLFRMYFPRNLNDARSDLAQFFTDYVFICPVRHLTQSTAQFLPTWLYVFDQPLTFLNRTGFYPLCQENACHGSELPYLFQSLERRGLSFSPQEQALADEFLEAVTNFAKTGNPNKVNATESQWPQYSAQNFYFPVKIFSVPSSRITTDYQGQLCNSFNQTYFSL